MPDPTPDPWQAEAGMKMEQWMNYGFDRVTAATVESGLIPDLHRLLEGSGGIDDGYAVFDAVETSAGIPVPVRTRYILPMGPPLKGEITDIYPGIGVFEIIGLGVRTIEVQIGLDDRDLWKLGVRGHAVMRNGGSRPEAPQWWEYEYRAHDLTRDYDLVQDPLAAARRVAEPGEDPRPLTQAYIWYERKHDEIIVFETEQFDQKTPKVTWQDYQSDTERELKRVEQIIDAFRTTDPGSV